MLFSDYKIYFQIINYRKYSRRVLEKTSVKNLSRDLHIIVRNLRKLLLNKNMFKGNLKIRFFIDISWRCLKTLIDFINSDNLVFF